MANLEANKIYKNNINNGQRFINGDGVQAESVNAIAEGLLYSDKVSEEASNNAIQTSNQFEIFKTDVNNRVNELESAIVEGQGTIVNVAGTPKAEISFNSDPQTQINNVEKDLSGLRDESTAKWIILNNLDNTVREQQTQINAKANIDSPAFIGAPTAPTPPAEDKSDKIATTETVKNQLYLITSDYSTSYTITNGVNLYEFVAVVCVGTPTGSSVSFGATHWIPTLFNGNRIRMHVENSSNAYYDILVTHSGNDFLIEAMNFVNCTGIMIGAYGWRK